MTEDILVVFSMAKVIASGRVVVTAFRFLTLIFIVTPKQRFSSMTGKFCDFSHENFSVHGALKLGLLFAVECCVRLIIFAETSQYP